MAKGSGKGGNTKTTGGLEMVGNSVEGQDWLRRGGTKVLLEKRFQGLGGPEAGLNYIEKTRGAELGKLL